jgi:hypothetical protein
MTDTLTREQYKALLQALCSAFSSDSLDQMVEFSLEQKLDEITLGANLSRRVFDLIGWAQRQGKLKELIAGARNENPGNPELKAFAEQFGHDVKSVPRVPYGRVVREHPFPETWKCDLSMIEDCVEALDQSGSLFGFAVSCNYDAFRESFSKRLEHVVGRGNLNVITPFTLSRLDTTDTVLKHARRMEQLKDKLQYRDLLCCVKLSSDNEQVVVQQAHALWQDLHATFAGNFLHRLIIVLFTQVDFEPPDGMIVLDPPRFRPAHVIEWIQDFAPALGWEDRFLMAWRKRIIENSIVNLHPPHILHVELVYGYLSRSLQLLSIKPSPSPTEFLDNLY